ncbi:MAG: VWA domain-containing protein [Planctomycetes bacterium]|nr:VWA domain-containing protein [Planctomycetota bacterium]
MGRKIFQTCFGVVLLAALVFVLLALYSPDTLKNLVAPRSTLSWANFNPMSREPGMWGLSPLIWTALVAMPLAVLAPVLVYIYEKKKVSPATRGLLAVSRGVALLFLWLLLAGPSLSDAEVYIEGSKLAVLIDDSQSMGAESREFPVFNVLDDREAEDVRALRQAVEAMGIQVDRPPVQGFVTLTPDELAVRNFVRKVVRERSARLSRRLSELHGRAFDIGAWQKKKAQVDLLSRTADLKQSELSAEQAREQPDDGRVRRLQSELDALLLQLQNAEKDFATLLEGSPEAEKTRQKRALVENLLETVHAEGPRRWDIACEMVAEGNQIALPKGKSTSLLDLMRQRAAELEEQNAGNRQSRRPMAAIRYFVFSTKFGRETLTDECILEVAVGDLDFRAPGGRLSEVDKALEEVRRYYTQADDLSTILMLTDGRDTAPREERAESALAKARRGVEIVTVAIGNPKPVKVLELLSVSADREILKGDYVEFKLKIRADKAYRADPARSKAGIKVKIVLCEDSLSNAIGYEELNGRPVRSPADMVQELSAEELTEVRVRYKPTVAGKHAYFLKLNEDRLPDEDTYRNNVKEHYLEVIDRKIKVLYLEQDFRWEARALNDALKRDKKLEYQGFFFSAQEGWKQPVSTYDAEVTKKVHPLRAPFYDATSATTGRVIREKEDFFKLNYDVIILGDIDPAGNFRREYWEWLEEWVSRHRGGLILLAGGHYNPRAYNLIEKARALYPVELDFPAGYDKMVNTTQEKFWRLTPAGRAHEVHRLSGSTERNDELWGSVRDGRFVKGQLNGVWWYQVTGGIKPAPAVALSRVVREGPITGEGDVLTAAMPYGNGMSLYIGSDDTHRMREFVGDHYFYRFWQNSIRFVASRRLAGKQQRVDVYTDQTRYQVGDDVKVYCELLGDIYDEVVQNQLKELKELPEAPEGERTRRLLVDVQARTQGRLTSRRVVLSEVSWSPNLFEGILQANEPGQFDVWVRGYEESRKAPHRYQVVAPVAELRDLTLDLEGLRRRATDLPAGVPPLEYQDGKRMYLMTDAGDAELAVRQRENEIKGLTSLLWDRKEDPLRLRSWLLVMLLVLLAGEWLTRKLSRLV